MLVTSNASPIEVLYTLVALVGFITSVANLLWSNERVAELDRSNIDGMLMVMRQGARQDQLKTSAALLCLMVIGFISMATPANPSVTQTGIVSGLLLVAVEVILTWKSISIRRRPGKLRAALAKEQR